MDPESETLDTGEDFPEELGQEEELELEELGDSTIELGDVEIVPDDPSDITNTIVDQEPLQAKQIFGFGYDIEVNPDGSVKIPECILTKDMIRTGLSHVSRTLDTFEFAYSRYDGRNKNLSNIDILEEYINLRVIDLSGNRIQSCKPLAPVKHLLVLSLSNNQLQSLEEIPELPFLQALKVSSNELKTAKGLFPNGLTYLNLSFNKITSVKTFKRDSFPWLTVLELRGNNISSLRGLDLPVLIRLFVADNELSDLIGLKGCPNLTHLHARDNKISRLKNFPKLELLEYVNLRNNALSRFTQTQFLGNSPNIRTLIAMNNPISALDNYKMEMITTNLNLKRLDKEPVTDLDLIQGEKLKKERAEGLAPNVQDDAGLITPPISILGDDDDRRFNEFEGEESWDQETSFSRDNLVSLSEEITEIPTESKSYETELGNVDLKGVSIKKGSKGN